MPGKTQYRFSTLVLLLGLAIFVASCTESCYKQEDNYADAGDAPQASASDAEDEGCVVGIVNFQAGMTHPDEPCLTCRFLEDGVSLGWTPVADGSGCDDLLFCNGAGYCAGGQCRFQGNPCPDGRPFCSEQYGGVCTEEPLGGFSDDDADECWACETTSECVYAFGAGWGCLDGCCESLSDDDVDDDDLDDDADDDLDDDADDDIDDDLA